MNKDDTTRELNLMRTRNERLLGALRIVEADLQRLNLPGEVDGRRNADILSQVQDAIAEDKDMRDRFSRGE